MSSPKSPRAALPAALAVLAAVSALTGAAAADSCFEAITGPAAQRIFDGLSHAKPSDGCTLENVKTDRAEMRIEWTKGGKLQEAMVVVPAACAHGGAPAGTLAIMVPPGAEAACPAAADMTRQLVNTSAADEVVKVTEPLPVDSVDAQRARAPRRRIFFAAGGAAAALAAAGGLAMFLRRRRAAAASGARKAAPPAEGAAATGGEAAVAAAPPSEGEGAPPPPAA